MQIPIRVELEKTLEMASFRICNGGNRSLHASRGTPNCRNSSHRSGSVAIARREVEIPQTVAARKVGEVSSRSHQRICHEKIDAWVHESATEIVKNLPNAPLLIHVIEEADGRKRRLKVEKGASAETWKNKKRHGVAEGVIVVEELKDGRDSRGVYRNGEMGGEEELNKAWGMVVQGRGLECGPVCYLLKTSRVRSSGCGCTHFSLVRVNGFDRTAERQLADVWLC